jgi:hypothetical protein
MRNRFVILLFGVLTFLLYFPILRNGFLTDDYASLYRLLIEKREPFRETIRPLIDISFYFNYLISGLHPVSYYIFNLCVHAAACFMVYRVALDLPLFTGRRGFAYALTAGLLFLFYPFHNEGVVWLSGRLSSMAALFGLVAIHFSLTKRWPWSFVLAALSWFAGLFAYESIIVLPAVILLFEWIKFRDVRRGGRSFVVWAAAGLVWLGMRYVVAGGLLPPYAQGTAIRDSIVLRFIKVPGRCFLPPLENSKLMIILFAGVVVLIGIVNVVVWRRKLWSCLLLEISFLLTLLPAVALGVSTRTTEGDRLLYFPSCILCLLAAAVVLLLPGRRWRLVLCGGYAVASVVFIIGNNRRWVFASRVAETTLNMLRSAPGRVVLVNAPDEWEGAYIFRNSFNQGLAVNGIDTNKVVVTHFLTRLEYLKMDGRIGPVRKDGSIFIYPATRLLPGGDDRVYYWDKYEWKPLILDHDLWQTTY